MLEYCAGFRLQWWNKSASELPWIKVLFNITIYLEVICSLLFQYSITPALQYSLKKIAIYNIYNPFAGDIQASQVPDLYWLEVGAWILHDKS